MTYDPTTLEVEDEETVECVLCGDATPTDETISTEDGETCQSCHDETYTVCGHCDETTRQDEIVTVDAGSDYVCESCRDNYYFWCEDCDEYRTTEYSSWVDSVDRQTCESCYDNYYSYCDYCDESYHYEDGHSCGGGCDCEAPGQTFKIRNDGNGMLSNDERTTVALPAGEISDVGVGTIAQLLRNHGNSVFRDWSRSIDTPDLYSHPDYTEHSNARQAWHSLSYRLDELGSMWQSKDGNYTKRLSRFAYKNHALKVPPAVLSEIGNIGNAHSRGVEFGVEVTRNLNLPAAEFAHEDSCWWQSYSESRCALKNNGGFGLRSFSDYGSVTGRAWVMPLKRSNGSLVPTTNTETPDAVVVFNGYGDLDGYSPARIMAHMLGMTYRKIGLYADPMYINGDSGYLVAPEEIARDYTDGNLTLDTDTHSSLYHRETAAAALV